MFCSLKFGEFRFEFCVPLAFNESIIGDNFFITFKNIFLKFSIMELLEIIKTNLHRVSLKMIPHNLTLSLQFLKFSGDLFFRFLMQPALKDEGSFFTGFWVF